MNPLDKLFGNTSHYDMLDDFIFAFFECEKFNGNTAVVDFEKGLVTIEDKDNGNMIEAFNIEFNRVKNEDNN